MFLRLLRVEHHEAIRRPEAYLAHSRQPRSSPSTHPASILKLPASGRRGGDLPDLQLTSSDDPLANVEMQQRIKDLSAPWRSCHPEYRRRCYCIGFGGFSIEEIGKRAGRGSTTAKKYLAQALLHCRNGRREDQ